MNFHPKKDTKDNNMDLHTIKRFRERYNFDAHKSDIKTICRAIQKNKNNKECTIAPLGRVSRAKTLFKVDYKGMNFVVVYHRDKKRLCTVLKPEMVKNYMNNSRQEEAF